MIVETKVCRLDAEPVSVPLHALFAPIIEPLILCSGFDEKLHLHLLELAGAEDEVSWRNFITERLADLRDAERRLQPARLLDIQEVDEYPLCGFWPQKRYCRVFFYWPDESLEHQVELTSLSEVAFHAFGALALGFGRNMVGTKSPLAVPAID